MVQIAAPDIRPNPDVDSVARNSIPTSPPAMIAGDEDVDSQEITQGDFSEINDIEPAGQPVAPPPIVESLSAIDSGATDDVAASDEALDEELPWTTAPSQDSRQKLLIGATALGLLSSLSILAFWFFSEPAATPTTRVVESNKIDEEPTVDLPSTDEPVASQAIPTDQETTAEIPFTSVSSKSQPAEALKPTESDVPSSMIPDGLLPVDSLRDPTGDAPGASDQVGPSMRVAGEEEDAPAIEPLVGLPPELEVFLDLLDVPGNAPDQPHTIPAENNVEELQVERAADVLIDPMMLAEPPPNVNIANALTYRVAISSKGYPLSDLLLLSSEATQIPFQVDWVTLDLAGISISQRVQDPKPEWKPIGDLLKGIATEVGIDLEQSPDQVLVTLSVEQYKNRLKEILSTNDFGSEQPSADELVAAFLKTVQWDEREKVGLQALITESLRRARDLPTKLNPVAIGHWTVVADCLSGDPIKGDYPEHWPSVDGGESGPQLDTAITLAGFLRHTSRLNGSTCIVNWQDARDRRLSPAQLVMPFAGDPAGTMLRKTLRPLGLNARQASAGVWWIGTDATYDRMPLLVIGDALGPKRDDILKRLLEAAMKADTVVLLQHDPVSDRYLSLMPRFLYRQLPNILKPFR